MAMPRAQNSGKTFLIADSNSQRSMDVSERCTMTTELIAAMDLLSPTQRQAADWGEGAALVLAGPGVGKTTVLTTRIARILDASRNRNFRILALTFTTKAGDEMRRRVES